MGEQAGVRGLVIERDDETLLPYHESVRHHYVSGLAAIDSGADAVYIGAGRFGARAKAGNSLDDIATLVEHAHVYWARVYVTINTLLHDDELGEAVRLIRQLYEAGVDALIVQDLGLLECGLPPLPLPWVQQSAAYRRGARRDAQRPARAALRSGGFVFGGGDEICARGAGRPGHHHHRRPRSSRSASR